MNNIVNKAVKFSTNDDEEIFLYNIDKLLKKYDVTESDMEISDFNILVLKPGMWEMNLELIFNSEKVYIQPVTKNREMVTRLLKNDFIYQSEVIMKLLKDNVEEFIPSDFL